MSGTNPPESEHNETIVGIGDGPLVPLPGQKAGLPKTSKRGRDEDLLLGEDSLAPATALEPVFGDAELRKESPADGTRHGARPNRGVFSGLRTQPIRTRDFLRLRSPSPGRGSPGEGASRQTSQTDAQSMAAALEEEEGHWARR